MADLDDTDIVGPDQINPILDVACGLVGGGTSARAACLALAIALDTMIEAGTNEGDPEQRIELINFMLRNYRPMGDQ